MLPEIPSPTLAPLWGHRLAGLAHPSSLGLRGRVLPAMGKPWPGSHSQEGHGRLWRCGCPGRGPGAPCPEPEALLRSLSVRGWLRKPGAHGGAIHVSFFLFFPPTSAPAVFITSGPVLCYQSGQLSLSKSPPGGGDKEGSLGGGLGHPKATHKTRAEVPGQDGKLHRSQSLSSERPRPAASHRFGVLRAAHFLTAQRKEPWPAFAPAFGMKDKDS